MRDLIWAMLGGLLLLAGVVVGYWRWIRPRQHSLDAQGTGLLLLIILTCMGGFIGAPFWWTAQSQSFSWRLPPLASRMLAAAGWSFVVVSIGVLERPSRRRVRLFLLLLAVYLVPLVLAVLLFHLGRFDFSAAITYSFFAIALGMAVASVWYLWRQPQLAGASGDDEPSSRLEMAWLGFVAIVTGLWGVALFVTDRGPSPSIWAWPGDLLTSRLIGVMLLAIAVGAATSIRYQEPARLMLAVIVTYGLGLALASFWNAVAGKPIKVAYLAVFGLLFLGSGALLVFKHVESIRLVSGIDHLSNNGG